jgi:putative transposase
VTPNERHEGREHDILGRRHTLYEFARRSNPGRWVSSTRNWSPIGLVVLNPPQAVPDAVP